MIIDNYIAYDLTQNKKVAEGLTLFSKYFRNLLD